MSGPGDLPVRRSELFPGRVLPALPGAGPELEALVAADQAFDRARAAVEAASRVRAAAAFAAHGRGASYGVIGAALGVSRPTALALVRAGEAIGPLPVAAPVALETVVPAAATSTVTPAVVVVTGGEPACLREGCPLPRDAGARFCAGHRWN